MKKSKIYIHADHWYRDDEETMIDADKPKKAYRYIADLLEHGYVVRCMRIVEVENEQKVLAKDDAS